MSNASASLTLVDGSHRVECRGVEAAGNTQPPHHRRYERDRGYDASDRQRGGWCGIDVQLALRVAASVTVSDHHATSTTVRGVLPEWSDQWTRLGLVRVAVLCQPVNVVVAHDGNHTLVLSSANAASNVGAVASVFVVHGSGVARDMGVIHRLIAIRS